MAGSKRLIVGLGNPGVAYEGTRHNVGFDVLDRLAALTRVSFDETGTIKKAVDRMRSAGLYVVVSTRFKGRPIALAKPLTFMNRSGKAVDRLIKRHGITSQDVLVVVDDINLALGNIRIRARGGSGGHNGLEDIIDTLDTDNFPRMRIGVGSTFPRGRQADYVLTAFSEEEIPLKNQTVDRASEAAITFVTDGIVTAMNRFNKRGATPPS